MNYDFTMLISDANFNAQKLRKQIHRVLLLKNISGRAGLKLSKLSHTSEPEKNRFKRISPMHFYNCKILSNTISMTKRVWKYADFLAWFACNYANEWSIGAHHCTHCNGSYIKATETCNTAMEWILCELSESVRFLSCYRYNEVYRSVLGKIRTIWHTRK